MASPPVLFSTAAFFARPIASTFRLAAESGYKGVEVMVTKDPDSQDPGRIAALAKEFGLHVGALHAPCLLVTRTIWGTDPVAKIDRSVETALSAEIPVVVVHPPYRWQRGFRRWLIEDLPGVEERSGVSVAVENMFPVRLGRRSVALHTDHALDDLEGLPHLVLDTSHAAVAGHDPIAVRARFAHRLRHVHLSDNAGRGWDSHLPPGDGVLDLDGFLRDLSASGYDGAVSLEVDLRPRLGHGDRLADLMVTMRERVGSSLEGRTAGPRTR